MTLGLTVICKGNDIDELNRLLVSVGGVFDDIYITWTKEKPEISQIISSTRVHLSGLDDKRTYFTAEGDLLFDEARNYNLSQATTDYIAWFDTDDIVVGADALRSMVNVMDRKELDAVYADYHYELSETGEVLVNHPRERIVKRGVFEWKGHLHETLIPSRQVKTQYCRDFIVEHHPTDESRVENMERNIRILSHSYQAERQSVLEGTKKEIDPRTEYYLARCYFDTHTHKGYERASFLFQDYLEHSGWDEERAQAWNYLGNIYFLSENYKDAEKCFISAIQERPEFPTWHINLARTYIALRDFKKAEFHITTAMRTPQPSTALVITPRDDEINTLLTLFMIYFEKKDIEKTIRIAHKLNEVHPTPENERRLESIKQLHKWEGWLKAVKDIALTLKADGETEKILSLISSLPTEIAQSQTVASIRSSLLKPTVWPENSIVYYCGQGFEPWSPKSLDKGIGGSEEAVIYVAREWAKLGKKVTVYGYPSTDEGLYDGVEYLNYYRFNPKDTFDTLIIWRNPYILRSAFDAKQVLLDLHDVPEKEIYEEDLHVDRIMVKSEYHKSLLPDKVYKKTTILSNGIDGQLLSSIEGNNTCTNVFYGSSYDRGLLGLLMSWPEVLKAIPEAQLHICYGWNLYAELYRDNPVMLAWKDRMEKLMLQKGIVHHGRVGKNELYAIAKSCGVWAYPATFEEIDCITGRYTQALGLYPVVYNYAALKTTVQSGVRLDIDPFNKESITLYTHELIKALKHPQSTSGNNYIIEYDWSKIAKRWPV